MLAVCQPPGPEHDPAVVGGHACGHRTSVEPPTGGREVALVSSDGERERGETGLADDRRRRAAASSAPDSLRDRSHEETRAHSPTPDEEQPVASSLVHLACMPPLHGDVVTEHEHRSRSRAHPLGAPFSTADSAWRRSDAISAPWALEADLPRDPLSLLA